MKPTPRTLREAIENGLEIAENSTGVIYSSAIIQQHVKDFLSQKMAAAYLKVDTDEKALKILTEFWEAATGGLK